MGLVAYCNADQSWYSYKLRFTKVRNSRQYYVYFAIDKKSLF